ncbi:hypothetical protein CS0771_47350 [Catellatospora sp. IY07-71]|nr:hypothetical protein CS0771_47350 [Catellatospora sp. IY07-71]
MVVSGGVDEVEVVTKLPRFEANGTRSVNALPALKLSKIRQFSRLVDLCMSAWSRAKAARRHRVADQDLSPDAP